MKFLIIEHEIADKVQTINIINSYSKKYNLALEVIEIKSLKKFIDMPFFVSAK